MSLSDDFTPAYAHLRNADTVFGAILDEVGPCLLKPSGDGFLSLVRAIIAQQVSAASAKAVMGRVEALFEGKSITADGLAAISDDELKSAGLSRQKRKYLMDLASHVTGGELKIKNLETMNDDAVIEALTQIKGIGVWTAEMYLMFCLNRPDIFSVGDSALRWSVIHAYKLVEDATHDDILHVAEKWRPWRTVASWYLYRYRHMYG